MKFGKSYCCTGSKGEDIYLFSLRNTKDTEVLITNYGAIITAIKIKKEDGTTNDIVLGFDKSDDYFAETYLQQYPYFGAAIGRYANRIKDASFTIDDKVYNLPKNQGNDHLHGGVEGFDKKVWDVNTFDFEPLSSLEMQYTSVDGEEGYPGTLVTFVRFELNDENELSYTYTAECDQPTAVNLTHHEYFNLNNGDGSMIGHRLKINSSETLEQDANLIVTGKLLPVDNTKYDFRDFRPIADSLANAGYDQSFVIDKTQDELALAAEVICDESNLMLQVFTTDPVVHFYAGEGIPSIKGKHNKQYGPYSGFCLETQVHPNAINIPQFPGTILRPGEKYYQKTVYKISELPAK